jgi:exopolyphosphatase/guanosine-5'-triphosphate,3'-diphosphate pyrophosphatase
MIIAILDLGTNTFNLLIAEKGKDGLPVFIYKKELPVEIGKGGIHKGYIKADATERAIKALHLHRKTIAEYGIEDLYAFATSAVRDASNGKEFVERIRIETGIEIKIVSGDEEAEWIYRGVKYASVLGEETSVIMDIGGGSTEFIIANQHQIFWKKSYPLGVTRLYEIFFPSDPMSKEKQAEVEKYITGMSADMFEAATKYKPVVLIGSSGSFDSFAQILICRSGANHEAENGFDFSMNKFDELYKDLLASTLEERLKMKGLIQMRAPMFVYSVILTKLVLDKLSIKSMRLSHYALKEGIAGYLLNELEGGIK